MYCFSQIEPRFFSFTASSSPNESLHGILKHAQPSEKEYSITIKNTLECVNQLIKNCHKFEMELTPFEDIFRLPELKAIRMVLSKPLFTKLI